MQAGPSPPQLESRVSELGREKADLEGRLEEEQDSVEELMEKQRSHIGQTGVLQAQLRDSQLAAEELREARQVLEARVGELEAKVLELESGASRHQLEANEYKVGVAELGVGVASLSCPPCQVRELEQKLDLERSSARRLESQVSRLRHQLERLQEDKSEDVSHKNNEALRRLQKQLRDLRSELQEAEHREQDQGKRRRDAVRGGGGVAGKGWQKEGRSVGRVGACT